MKSIFFLCAVFPHVSSNAPSVTSGPVISIANSTVTSLPIAPALRGNVLADKPTTNSPVMTTFVNAPNTPRVEIVTSVSSPSYFPVICFKIINALSAVLVVSTFLLKPCPIISLINATNVSSAATSVWVLSGCGILIFTSRTTIQKYANAYVPYL